MEGSVHFTRIEEWLAARRRFGMSSAALRESASSPSIAADEDGEVNELVSCVIGAMFGRGRTHIASVDLQSAFAPDALITVMLRASQGRPKACSASDLSAICSILRGESEEWGEAYRLCEAETSDCVRIHVNLSGRREPFTTSTRTADALFLIKRVAQGHWAISCCTVTC